jgi:hypothetical protein
METESQKDREREIRKGPANLSGFATTSARGGQLLRHVPGAARSGSPQCGSATSLLAWSTASRCYSNESQGRTSAVPMSRKEEEQQERDTKTVNVGKSMLAYVFSWLMLEMSPCALCLGVCSSIVAQ